MMTRRKLFAWLTGAAIAPVLPVQAQWVKRSGMQRVSYLRPGLRNADPCLISDRQMEIFRVIDCSDLAANNMKVFEEMKQFMGTVPRRIVVQEVKPRSSQA